jgi:hypothetical protein
VSGSWVIRDEKLCGYIIAVQDGSPWVYMLPIEGVFDDITSFTGSTQVVLVSGTDPEPATQQTDPRPAKAWTSSILPRPPSTGRINTSTQPRQHLEEPIAELTPVVPPAAPPRPVVEPRRPRVRLRRIFKPYNWGQPRRRRRSTAPRAPFWSRVAKLFGLARIWSALEVFFGHLRGAINAQRSPHELLKIITSYHYWLFLFIFLEVYLLGESFTLITNSNI